MPAAINPAIAPTFAPSPLLTGRGVRLINIFAATAPPTSSQAQKQQLAKLINGITERSPAITPPTSAGCFQSSSIRWSPPSFVLAYLLLRSVGASSSASRFMIRQIGAPVVQRRNEAWRHVKSGDRSE